MIFLGVRQNNKRVDLDNQVESLADVCNKVTSYQHTNMFAPFYQ